MPYQFGSLAQPGSALAGKVGFRRVFSSLLAASLLLALAAISAPVQASTLEIQFTGLNLDYDGTNIFDSPTHNTVRAGNPAQADSLTSMSFLVDNTLVGSVITSDIFADIYISGITNVPATGGVVNSSGNGGAFGIDLLTNNVIPGWGLALDINTMQFFYTGSNIAINVSGVATNIAAQMLPFGLEFEDSMPVTISITSANLTNVTTSGGFLTGLKAAGTGNVAGILVPEPSSFILLGLGLATAALYAFRKRR